MTHHTALIHEDGPSDEGGLPDDGMATAEYAVGTLGACSIALVLHGLATDGSIFDLIAGLFRLLDGFPPGNLRLR
ncbi:DUF4244 domain-containing protein [Aeromicrobium fastidiosum]|uniref:DUF4244 domain-containing protein n=1 Tax=Aeromicrobium fastidiosum TaxID=52699 RepID=A0A641AS56_9ACTN|nr:DUF4244 domain-containing protein [Aeromicrobium fastidiosum]KAA1380775.1 DUF4244 domain-containing protein [Aeromicrobium fastidiosum]MBP2390394.1 hypothetical protein [Aeromicrobium fastidiosum]